MFWASITTILFSLSALFAQRTSRLMGGISANFWRILVATFLLGLWSHTFGIGLQGPTLPWFFVGGILGFGIGDVALFQALPRIGSRLSILIVHCLATPIGAITEYFWLGTQLRPTQIGCMILALSGVAIALAPTQSPTTPSPASTPTAPGSKQYSLGLLAAFIASLGQCFGAVISRKANSIAELELGHRIHGIDAAYQRIWGGLLVSALVFGIAHLRNRLREPAVGTSSSPDDSAPLGAKTPPGSKPWLAVVANALAGPVLGVSCFQWALATTPTGIVLPIVALTPLVIIPFAHWMEGERTTHRELLGGIIAVAGVSLLAYITHTPSH